MPRAAPLDSLADLLDASNRPIYAIDERRQIVYCNRALTAWLDLQRTRIIGRLVEYHSDSSSESAASGEARGPLTDLCPPPRALAGEPSAGTISCVTRSGGLAHRRASFVPLGLSAMSPTGRRNDKGVLVFLADRDLTPQELAAELSDDPSGDELHRIIRQFRRGQTASYAIETLIGESAAMRKVRSQAAAAALSGANTLICGRPGTGRGHVARAIHYRAAGDAPAKLVPVDCGLANEDLLRRAFAAVRDSKSDSRSHPTLLLENIDRLAESLQSQVLELIRRNAIPARIVATCSRHTPCAAAESPLNSQASTAEDSANSTPTRHPAKPAAGCPVPATIDAALLDAISTITIHLPRLCERLEDLPVLAQFFLEAANRDRGKQVGALRADALDLLALHTWPGELDELREVIADAHRAANTHEITPADLPPVVHHAAKSAAHTRREPERIVLDELLANIEKEAIVRALAQSDGNKTEAAELLGMTRPRLYRRLVQLGMAGPEFIEREPGDETQ
jgi:DNA-binding NtrC family response regulator